MQSGTTVQQINLIIAYYVHFVQTFIEVNITVITLLPAFT